MKKITKAELEKKINSLKRALCEQQVAYRQAEESRTVFISNLEAERNKYIDLYVSCRNLFYAFCAVLITLFVGATVCLLLIK